MGHLVSRFSFLASLLLLLAAAPAAGQCVTAAPAFDDNAAKVWRYGLSRNSNQTAVTLAKASDDVWGVVFEPLPLFRGAYTITHIRNIGLSGTDAAQLDGARLCVAKLSGSDIVVQSSVDILSALSANASAHTDSDLDTSDVSFTIAAGETWYFGIALHKAQSADAPAWHTAQAGVNPPTGTVQFTSGGAAVAALGSFPTTWDTGDADSTTGNYLLCAIELSTTNIQVYESAASPFTGPTAISLAVPYKLDEPFTTIVRGVTTANGQTTTVAFNRDASTAAATLVTHVADFGATDQDTFDGANMTVNSASAGQLVDYYYQFWPSGATTRGNLLRCCRNRGEGGQGNNSPILRSHAAATTAARYTAGGESGQTGRELDAAAVRPIEFLRISASSTSTITNIAIGTPLPVYFGDSGMGSAGAAFSSGTSTGGRLGLALHHELIGDDSTFYCNVGRANRAMARAVTSTSEAGYLVYQHTTPGQGDVCDLRRARLYVHIGGNDMKADAGASGVIGEVSATTGIATSGTAAQIEARINTRISELTFLTTQMLHDWMIRNNERNNRAFVFGMIDYNDPGQTETIHNLAFARWDDALEGICAGLRVPFYSQRRITAGGALQESDGVHWTWSTTAPLGGAQQVAAAAYTALTGNRAGCVGAGGGGGSGLGIGID